MEPGGLKYLSRLPRLPESKLGCRTNSVSISGLNNLNIPWGCQLTVAGVGRANNPGKECSGCPGCDSQWKYQVEALPNPKVETQSRLWKPNLAQMIILFPPKIPNSHSHVSGDSTISTWWWQRSLVIVRSLTPLLGVIGIAMKNFWQQYEKSR